MGEDAAENPVGRDREAGRRTLEVVVIYDDLEAAGRARQSLENLQWARRAAPIVSTRLWKLELLENSFLREQAAKEAAIADLILLAVSAVHTLPACVRKWLRRWAEYRSAHPCTFCLLGGPKTSRQAGEPQARAALENLVRRAGAEFFVGVCRAPGAAALKTPPSVSPAVLEPLARKSKPPTRWGVSE